jgi:DNA-directed RNA polymerase subunit RPC12/RpoP
MTTPNHLSKPVKKCPYCRVRGKIGVIRYFDGRVSFRCCNCWREWSEDA